MILRNLRTIDNHLTHLFLHEEGKQFELSFNEALVIPGLVNSHDHLDFNLFPQLGEKKFNNYTEWGRHIHRHHKKEISQVLKIPKKLRSQWGLYKNLLCGVTTVVHHGPRVEIEEPLIHVHQQSQSIHSVHFEKWWKWKLNNPRNKKKTCVVHTGEGTDHLAANEIDHLLRWNMLNRPLVGIHGVAMKKEQASQFAGLVWCPASNDFLFGKTAAVEEFDTTILLGSDSTLTGSWNMWDHIRFAREQCRMRDHELFNMLTLNAAKIWGLPGYGEKNKLPSDLVIAQTNAGPNMMDRFFEIDPASILLVCRSGRIMLFDGRIRQQLQDGDFDMKGFYRVKLGLETKWVRGNLPKLIQSIKKYHPGVDLPVQEHPMIAEA